MTIITVAIGLAFFYDHWEEPNLSPGNILNIEGPVHDYSFKENMGFRARGKQYYIWLDNYPCTFQIKADFLSFFKKTQFEKEVKRGNIMQMTVPKEVEPRLYNTENYVLVFSASKGSTNYLNLEDCIKDENSNFEIFAGLGFILAGIAYYLLKRRGVIKR